MLDFGFELQAQGVYAWPTSFATVENKIASIHIHYQRHLFCPFRHLSLLLSFSPTPPASNQFALTAQPPLRSVAACS